MISVLNTLLLLIILLAAFTLGFYVRRIQYDRRIQNAKRRARRIREKARDEHQPDPDELEQKKREIEQYRQTLQEQIESLKETTQRQREHLDSLEERLTNRQALADKTRQDIQQAENHLNNLREQLDERREIVLQKLEDKGNRRREDVLETLEKELVSDAELRAQTYKKRREDLIEEHRDKHAVHVLSRTIPRCDITTPVDVPSAVLKFPDDDAYHQFLDFYEEHSDRLEDDLDTDIRFESEPDRAVVETLEPVQKEIAHRTLNNLIQQKKFYYELVEEGIERYTRQVEAEQSRAAREALQACRISEVPESLVSYLGVLKFRTSYGQQQLVHSQEVALLGSLMAHEIGANADLTRRAGMLHDIGKAIDRQRDNGHAVIGAELADEAGETDLVVNAIGSHHGDMEPEYTESFLVAAADAISGSRPGVRRQTLSNYSERIQSLLELAQEREGIRKVYAMNAGRELRIRVNRHVVRDQDLEGLAREIAREIEDELTYSGQIKVNTIRETKITETARTQ